MKVKIRDYQAIRRAELDFKEGLTVIIGPTNSGKSAILRAIDSAIFNKGGDSFIREGQKLSAVQIKNGPDTVTWKKLKKGDPKTQYTINGDIFQKPGRNQLEEVKDTLKISEIKMINSKEKLNFWKQMKYPFLLDKTPGQLFEFLSLSGQDDNLTEVVKDMKRDLGEMNVKATKIEGSIESFEETVKEERAFVESREGFEDVYSGIISKEQEIKTFQDLDETVRDMAEKGKKFKGMQTELSVVVDTLDLIAPHFHHASEESHSLESLDEGIEELEGIKNKAVVQGENLKRINASIATMDIDQTQESLNRVVRIQKELEEMDAIIRRIKELDEKQDRYDRELEKVEKYLQTVDFDKLGENVVQVRTLQSEIETLDGSMKVIKGVKSQYDQQKDKLEGIKKDLEIVYTDIEEFNVCPLCNTSLKEGGDCGEGHGKIN